MALFESASLVVTPNGTKASKLYSVKPADGSGDMTVTRATTATRVNASGIIESVATNVPRLDYTGSTCPGILLEPQRTNLNTNYLAQDWSGTLIKTNNFGISPENIQNSTQLINNVGNNQDIRKTFSVTSGLTYTFSFYVRKTSGTFSTGQARAYTFPSPSSNVDFSDVSTQWKRYSLTFTATLTAPLTFQIRTDAISTIQVYGLQIEVGTYPTSIIPTVASAVTRNSDVISRNNIYTNNLITAAGGTWFVELNNNFSLIRDVVINGLYISDSLTLFSGNSFEIRSISGTSTRLSIIKRILNVQTILYNTLTDVVKLAIKWNGTTADVFVNGVKVVSGTTFTTTNMEFLNGGGQDVPKNIKSTILFPTPLTDTECINLTTL